MGVTGRLPKGAVESVWYVRRSLDKKKFFGCHSTRERDVTKIGLGWIATLLETGLKNLQLKSRYYRSHRWSTPDAYTSHVTKVRAEIQRDAGAILDRLLKARLLAQADRGRLVFEPLFEIKDDRDDKRVPLSKVPGIDKR